MVKPRIAALPFKSKASDAGDEAVALAKQAGLTLDDWQAHVLREGMRRKRNGEYAYFEIGLCVARQNGKGSILEARELAGIFIAREQMIIHSAHLHDTSLEHFRRLWQLIEENDFLLREVKKSKYGRVPTRGSGTEGIEFEGDRRIRFRTRTKGGGRGFSGDVLVLDEAMFMPEFTHGALLPTLSARPDPQVWYAGSPVDQLIHEHGVVFARVRERGIANDKGLAYFEWSVEGDNPSGVEQETLEDQAAWAQANPALGIRITPEHVDREYRSLDMRTFAVERLGIGDWPRTDHEATVIDLYAFAELEDADSKVLDPVCLAFDVSPERVASVSAAGRRSDDRWHIEVIASKQGTAWVPAYIAERVKKHRPSAVVCDGYGPAASLIPALEALGVTVETTTAGEHAQACGRLVDAIDEGTIRYPPSLELASAVRSARTRPLGDSWAWSRKDSAANISPLVSVTLALSAAMTTAPRKVAFARA